MGRVENMVLLLDSHPLRGRKLPYSPCTVTLQPLMLWLELGLGWYYQCT